MYSEFLNIIRQKKVASAQRNLTNFINFVGDGIGTRSLNQTLVDCENKIDDLKEKVCVLQNAYANVIQALPIQWIENKLIHIQTTLERNVAQSALVLRKLLGPIELEPVLPELGRPYYTTHTILNAITILDKGIAPHHSEKGANQFHWRSPVKLIRTLGSVPVSITIVDPNKIPIYQKVAYRASYLNDIGFSHRRIARILEVRRQDVSKAIGWLR